MAYKEELGTRTPLPEQKPLVSISSDPPLLGCGAWSYKSRGLGAQDGGTIPSLPKLRVTSAGPHCDRLLRRKMAGRDVIPIALRGNIRPTPLVSEKKHRHTCLSHHGEREPDCRSSVERDPDPNGMVLTGRHVPKLVPPARNPKYHSVRLLVFSILTFRPKAWASDAF